MSERRQHESGRWFQTGIVQGEKRKFVRVILRAQWNIPQRMEPLCLSGLVDKVSHLCQGSPIVVCTILYIVCSLL